MTASTPDHQELRRRLAWMRSTTLRGRYLHVFMDQNNKCNLRCLMCGFADPRVESLTSYDMPRALFDSIAAQIFPLAAYVQLSMFTEPFMTAGFADRLAMLREYEVPQSQIITNGTLLTDLAAGKIIDAQVSRVTISVDGGTKEHYEEIRIGARFERVVENVVRLQAMRNARNSLLPRIRLNHVLSRWNIDRFDRFLQFAEELAVDELDVRAVERMTHTTGDEWNDPSFVAKVLALRPRFVEFCQRTGVHDAGYLRDQGGAIDLFNDSGERLTCRRPWDTVAIHANGEVRPCMSWTRPRLGSLACQTFEEIWNGEIAESLRREFEAVKPGIDCIYCTIKKDRHEPYDDFFYRMLANVPEWANRRTTLDKSG